MDGDKSSELAQHQNLFLGAVENPKDKDEAKEWIGRRLMTLPGNTWPESWILGECDETMDETLADQFSTTEELLQQNIKKAQLAEKHSEFYILARELGHYGNEDFICQTLCRHIAMKQPDLFSDIRNRIMDLLI